MKRMIARAMLVAAAGVISTGAAALPLSEYNVIVAGDYIHQSASVGGKVFVGGNLLAQNSLDVGLDLDRKASFDSLVTVGDIKGNGGWFNVQAGSVVYGGEVQRVGFNLNGDRSVQTVTKGDQVALQNQRDAIINELNNASTNYAQMSANGQVVAAQNVVTLNYSGTGDTAVFNVHATDVFKQNANLRLNAGSAETVIINVSTAHLAGGAGQVAYDFTAPGGINFNVNAGFGIEANANNIGASNILWNFYDATQLSLQGVDTFRDSLLAMGANVTSIGTADGSIAVKSLIQNRQIHNYTFVPPSEVPLPAPIQFMLIGLSCLLGLKQWRKRKAQATANLALA